MNSFRFFFALLCLVSFCEFQTFASDLSRTGRSPEPPSSPTERLRQTDQAIAKFFRDPNAKLPIPISKLLSSRSSDCKIAPAQCRNVDIFLKAYFQSDVETSYNQSSSIWKSVSDGIEKNADVDSLYSSLFQSGESSITNRRTFAILEVVSSLFENGHSPLGHYLFNKVKPSLSGDIFKVEYLQKKLVEFRTRLVRQRPIPVTVLRDLARLYVSELTKAKFALARTFGVEPFLFLSVLADTGELDAVNEYADTEDWASIGKSDFNYARSLTTWLCYYWRARGDQKKCGERWTLIRSGLKSEGDITALEASAGVNLVFEGNGQKAIDLFLDLDKKAKSRGWTVLGGWLKLSLAEAYYSQGKLSEAETALLDFSNFISKQSFDIPWIRLYSKILEMKIVRNRMNYDLALKLNKEIFQKLTEFTDLSIDVSLRNELEAVYLFSAKKQISEASSHLDRLTNEAKDDRILWYLPNLGKAALEAAKGKNDPHSLDSVRAKIGARNPDVVDAENLISSLK